MLIVPATEATVDKLQVDFEILSVEQHQMVIQLQFENPDYVSIGYDPDLIQLSFHNSKQWLVTPTGFYVPEGYFVQSTLPLLQTTVILKQ